MKYHIKNPKYETNPQVTNLEEGIEYWTKKRLIASAVYQYYVYDWALTLFKSGKYLRIVDVGCGPATKLFKFFGQENVELVGIDQKAAIDFCCSNYEKGKFLVDDFDNPKTLGLDKIPTLFICCDVVEHLSRPERLLSYLFQKMTADCRVLISTPERDKLRGIFNSRPTNYSHVREWNSLEFQEFLKENQFQILNQKLFYPVRFTCNYFNIIHLVKQITHRRSLFTNQVFLLKK